MAAKRKRYIVTGNWKINDVDLKGVRLVHLGECNAIGAKSTKEKKILKRELTHELFKFEDDKQYKVCRVDKKKFHINFRKSDVSKFLTEVQE